MRSGEALLLQDPVSAGPVEAACRRVCRGHGRRGAERQNVVVVTILTEGGACRSHWVLSTLSNDPCLGLFCLYVLFVVGHM